MKSKIPDITVSFRISFINEMEDLSSAAIFDIEGEPAISVELISSTEEPPTSKLVRSFLIRVIQHDHYLTIYDVTNGYLHYRDVYVQYPMVPISDQIAELMTYKMNLINSLKEALSDIHMSYDIIKAIDEKLNQFVDDVIIPYNNRN